MPQKHGNQPYQVFEAMADWSDSYPTGTFGYRHPNLRRLLLAGQSFDWLVFPMARPLPLILAQAPGRPADDLAGFATDVERRVKLHAPGALVVYPELHLGESAPGIPAAPEQAAEPLDGKRDAVFAELAGDLGIWLVPGSVYERGTGDHVHNTTPVYSPQGERQIGRAHV